MSALFALVATVLTSFLPILNKYLLRDTRPAFVAWITNTASLPILALGTLFLTQCSITWHGSLLLSCTVQVPHVDGIFVAALLASVVLNWAATLLSTVALSKADAGLVSPLLTFNPAFTLPSPGSYSMKYQELDKHLAWGWCCWEPICSRSRKHERASWLRYASCSVGLERCLPFLPQRCGVPPPC